MALVNEGSHSFTCHLHVYPQVELAIPAFTPQRQNITAFWPVLIFSERELTSRSLYAIARPSVCLSSVCRLSVDCNVRAPYSGGSNFRQYFYGIMYLGHPLTSTEIFTEMSQGNLSAGGVKQKRGSKI